MSRIVETTVYPLKELSDAAKARARDWYRQDAPPDDWFECVYDDFEEICAILGVRLRTRSVHLYGGGTRAKPCIYFSGFWSQGDGASFEADYAHTPKASQKIRAHAPQDNELHEIADRLVIVQRCNFYQLRAGISQSGRYCHENTMTISVERDSPTGQSPTAGAEDAVTELMRDLARWLYRQLERDYEHHTSDDVVDETILANDYSFTAEGRRFG